jgi:hypothetical protein
MQNIEEFLLRKHCKEGASVATQFLTHVFDKFLEKIKNSKKNNENPQKMHFDIFASFLAFLTSFQKNLNFQKYFERVQLLTRKFYNH